jgi:hypothetical protein
MKKLFVGLLGLLTLVFSAKTASGQDEVTRNPF